MSNFNNFILFLDQIIKLYYTFYMTKHAYFKSLNDLESNTHFNKVKFNMKWNPQRVCRITYRHFIFKATHLFIIFIQFYLKLKGLKTTSSKI